MKQLGSVWAMSPEQSADLLAMIPAESFAASGISRLWHYFPVAVSGVPSSPASTLVEFKHVMSEESPLGLRPNQIEALLQRHGKTIAPEVLLRYCCSEICIGLLRMHPAWRWFMGLGFDQKFRIAQRSPTIGTGVFRNRE